MLADYFFHMTKTAVELSTEFVSAVIVSFNSRTSVGSFLWFLFLD